MLTLEETNLTRLITCLFLLTGVSKFWKWQCLSSSVKSSHIEARGCCWWIKCKHLPGSLDWIVEPPIQALTWNTKCIDKRLGRLKEKLVRSAWLSRLVFAHGNRSSQQGCCPLCERKSPILLVLPHLEGPGLKPWTHKPFLPPGGGSPPSYPPPSAQARPSKFWQFQPIKKRE